MEPAPKTAELSALTGISLSYASEITNGKRIPARALAIHILRKTGWRHPVISDLTDAQIDMLESIEPWSPRPTPDAAAAA